MFPSALQKYGPRKREPFQNWLGRARDGLDLLVEFATLGEYAGPSHRQSLIDQRVAESAVEPAAGWQHTDCPTPKRERRWVRVPRRAGAVVAPAQVCVFPGDR